MFGTMKKAMVVAAVAAVSAVAPAVASADVWTSAGNPGTPFAGTAHASGHLTLTVTANGATTTCDVTASLDLSNPMTDHDNNPATPDVPTAHGEVTDFLLGADAGPLKSCETSLPNCEVSATASSLPWTISVGAGTSVTISGVGFTNTYVDDGLGGDCALEGVPVSASGAITGTASGDTITFTNAGPLSTSLFGPATVDGSVTVEDTNGNPISLS